MLVDRLRDWLGEVIVPGAMSEGSLVREFTTIGTCVYRAIACNPKRYNALAACRALEEITWTAEPGSIEVGDRVVIWQTLNDRGKRGIVGIGECIVAPTLLPEPETELPFWKQTPPGPVNRCRIRLFDAPELPLWIDEHEDLLADLPVAKAHGGTFFSLSREKWQAIRQLAGAPLRAEPVKIDAVGQGRQLDPRVRKAVETRAMDLAEAYFLEDGWLVDPDVHKTESYDLLCTKDGQTLYVEAKGTVGAGEKVILTRNEVAHVRDNPGACALFVVSGIEITYLNGRPQAAGGRPQIFHPWQIDDEALSATQYDYRVPDAN